ncbi:MAG: D-alanine--D-alanine ligase [Clostridia bacterium]|nr:D-alanine--D-alanine ligase [Clostridia bacterium]
MKINVGVFFGGKSVEHEVAVITAVEAMNALDQNKYNVIPIYITKEGEFYTGKDMFDINSFKDIPALLDKSTNVTVSVNEREHSIINNEAGLFFKKVVAKIDVAFPIMHGTNGEDGTIQGLFELMNIPYVGSNIVASANGMDKITMKMILKETGLPTVPYVWFFGNKYFDNKETILRSIVKTLDFPVIVKPANLGSSVGISCAKNMQELEEAIDTATSYSTKIIVEKMVENLREINVSVLGDYEEAYPSCCEEPLRTGDILSYNDKYAVGAKGGAKGSNQGMAASYHKMPADLPEEIANKLKECAVMTFIALNCSGIARVDFLMDSATNEIYVNEINTIPGSLSYYFWESAGMPFNVLLDKLIELAVKKHKEKNKLIFTNNINILSIKGKGPQREERVVRESEDINNPYEDIELNSNSNNNTNSSNNDNNINNNISDNTNMDYNDFNNDNYDNDKYDDENPILHEEINNSSASQISLEEMSGMKFNDMLNKEMSEGRVLDVTIGDEEDDDTFDYTTLDDIPVINNKGKESNNSNNEESFNPMDALDVDLSSDIDVKELDEIKDFGSLQTVEEKLNEVKNNNANNNKEVRHNTAEPFSLFKAIEKNTRSPKEDLSAFENPDAFSNGDLKIKGVKNTKKKQKGANHKPSARDNAFDEFFGPDNK